MDEQLERHLDRVFSNNNGCTEETNKLEVIMTKKQEWELDPTKLKVNNIIAKGAYGSVYKGVYDGKQVAVKILDLSNEKRRNIVTKAFTQEVSIWYNLHHPNIAKLIGGSKTLPPESTRWMKKWTRHPSLAKQTILEYGIVVEYVPGALDVARGLSYLHSKKIVHRDVKSSNLVVDKEGRVKIIDFGVSRIEASCPINMTAQTGTIGYMAPESLRPEIPKTCPSAVANIMKQCWNANPKKRPEMKEVVLMLEAIDTTQDPQKGCFCLI
ncbi:hypothetical protein KY289_006233 [Solanum tuberosum]|nr:hypothetical protein KY284_005930 [Solanum tuberosum]KAH0723189.1 hypothetical protein KY289_006233 [Solanum tuberosum]